MVSREVISNSDRKRLRLLVIVLEAQRRPPPGPTDRIRAPGHPERTTDTARPLLSVGPEGSACGVACVQLARVADVDRFILPETLKAA